MYSWLQLAQVKPLPFHYASRKGHSQAQQSANRWVWCMQQVRGGTVSQNCFYARVSSGEQNYRKWVKSGKFRKRENGRNLSMTFYINAYTIHTILLSCLAVIYVQLHLIKTNNNFRKKNLKRGILMVTSSGWYCSQMFFISSIFALDGDQGIGRWYDVMWMCVVDSPHGRLCCPLDTLTKLKIDWG